MEGFEYKYGFMTYPVFGMDLGHARKNAVLEAFFRYHHNHPKMDMKVAQGTDYSSVDKFKKRADTLISYIFEDPQSFDSASRDLLKVVKQAYSTTVPIGYVPIENTLPKHKRFFKYEPGKERTHFLNIYKILVKKQVRKRCGNFLSGENCYIALAAFSREPLIILGYPKHEYVSLKNWYCSVEELEKVDKADRFIKVKGQDYVNIDDVRHGWHDRTNRTKGYQALSYCGAISDAVDNYDYYLAKFTNEV
jgi:hypothetical protein